MRLATARLLVGFVVILAWLAPHDRVGAEEIAQRIEHLIKAAAHLEQAGESDQAAAIRRQIQKQHVAEIKKKLAERLAERERLLADIDQLQRVLAAITDDATTDETVTALPEQSGSKASDDAAEQIVVSARIVEIDQKKMRSLGLEFNSLQGPLFDRSKTGSYIDDSGSISRFVEILQRQDFAKTIAAPKIVTTSGRQARIETIDDQSNGYRLTVMPKLLESGQLRLEACLNWRHGKDLDPQPTDDSHEFTLELKNGQSAVVTPPAESSDKAGNATLILLTAELLDPQGLPEFETRTDAESTAGTASN